MKLYKSLIFREWKLTRRRFLLMLMLFLLLCALMVFPILFYADDVRGNSSDALGAYAFFSALLALLGGILAGTNNGLQKADIITGWQRYAIALPPTPSQAALSDLLVKLLQSGIFALCVVAYTVVCAWLTGSLAALHAVNIYLIFAAAALLCDAVYSAMILCAQDKHQLKAVGAAAFFVAGLIYTVISRFFGSMPDSGESDGALISDAAMQSLVNALGSGRLLLILLAVFAAVCAVYYFAMRRMHERRDP